MVCGAALPNISRRKYESEILRELLQQLPPQPTPPQQSTAQSSPYGISALQRGPGPGAAEPGLSNDKALASEQLPVLEQWTEELENLGT